VFALDISDRLISRQNAALPDPWWLRVEPRTDTEWAMQSWIWRPADAEAGDLLRLN
jgi:hypothetical protein